MEAYTLPSTTAASSLTFHMELHNTGINICININICNGKAHKKSRRAAPPPCPRIEVLPAYTGMSCTACPTTFLGSPAFWSDPQLGSSLSESPLSPVFSPVTRHRCRIAFS